MVTRFEKLQSELPHPDNPSPHSAAVVQELPGGKFGEMATFMSYTVQSFNFRGRENMRPFYDLVANSAAEECGHIELMSYAINLLVIGTMPRGDDPPDSDGEPPLTDPAGPDIDSQIFLEVAGKLFPEMKGKKKADMPSRR